MSTEEWLSDILSTPITSVDCIEPHIWKVEMPEKTLVYKESDWDDTSVAAEPHIVKTLRAKTNLPLPEIHYADSDADPPFFLMEFLEGDQLSHAHQLSVETVIQYAESLGRYLGEIHQLELPAVGQLVYTDGEVEPLYESNISVEQDFEKAFNRLLSEFSLQAEHNQFDVTVPQFELDIPAPDELTYCPLDFHIHLVDDGVNGVIDFERVYAGHPRWAFENTLYMLTVTRREDESAWITEAFKNGYSDIRPIPDYYPVFELAAVLREMRAAHVWWGDVERHRDRLEQHYSTLLDHSTTR